MARSVTRRLVIECGAAETRAALFDGDEAVKFWFAPARGDEALPRPVEAGDICLARVKTVSKPLSGAFVDIGEAEDAFLPSAKAAAPPVEGAAVIVGVKRPAIAGKGALLHADWRRGLTADAQMEVDALLPKLSSPQAVRLPIDAALMIARDAAAFSPDEAVIDRHDAAEAMRGTFALRADESAALDADMAGAIDEALLRAAPLAGGGRMIFDETEALTAVDIDMGGLADAAWSVGADAVNKAAARRLYRELSKRSVGGRIVVDFLPPSGPRARRELLDFMMTHDADIFPRRIGKLAPDGLLDLTAPRRERSLLERATEYAGGDFARAGRRETIDWRAKSAMFALERALRRSPSVFFKLLAGRDLAVYLKDRERWTSRLAARYGGRFDVREDPRFDERRFEVAEAKGRQ